MNATSVDVPTEFAIPSYPKIYQLGSPEIADLFKDPVVVQEKVDGSQISFGVINGKLTIHSHHCQLDLENAQKMFYLAICNLKEREHLMMPGVIYRGEYLQKPSHNLLIYNAVPEGHIALFDVSQFPLTPFSPSKVRDIAKSLNLGCVPTLLDEVIITDPMELKNLMETISFLGGQKIEGIVIKNYHRSAPYGGTMMGKWVSDTFKEIKYEAKSEGKDFISVLADIVATQARWEKAVIHLKEQGLLTDSLKDIGGLIQEVQKDTAAEAESLLKDKLWAWAWPQIKKKLTYGLPIWYKEKLLSKQFTPQE